MSLQVLANTLQNQGRGNDSMLVHMTPGEVAGLQSLALSKGGSLTINPVTGLPEAGFLDTILSIGGGLVGGMIGGPLGAGIGSGLGSYLGGASPQQALMSGVLGYGLSGLGGALENTGVEALNKQAMESLITPEAAAQNLAANQGPYDLGVDDSAFSQTPEQFGRQVGDIITKNNALPWYEKMGAGWNAVDPMQFAKDNWKYLGAAGLGAAGMLAPKPAGVAALSAKTGYADTNYAFNKPQQVIDPVTGQVRIIPASYTRGSPVPYTYYAANGGAVPYPAGGVGYPQQNVLDKTDFYAQSTANPTPTAVVGAAPKTDYDARITQQGDEFKAAGGGKIYSRKPAAGSIYEYDDPLLSPEVQEDLAFAKLWGSQKSAAEGGTVKMADGGLPGFLGLLAQSGVFDSAIQNKPVQYSYDPREQRYTQLAQGGIASLGEYAAGGKLLEGPGDGMSDSIPAVIKGPKPQRAALAQGEFVIPADVVSHLGNGSTDAGAKRLYSMMDKIRMARTGTKKQGRQINPAKFMPA